MDINTLRKMAIDNVKENVVVLFEVLDLYELEQKNELKKLSVTNPGIIDETILNIIMLYALHAFIEDQKEINKSMNEIQKITEIEPLTKEILAIYTQVLHVKDINPILPPDIADSQNEKLKKLLLSF